MAEGFIDLHVHTTASDGTLSPAALVNYAREKGLTAVAITDHDTVEGLAEGIRTAGEIGLELVPGVEISVEFRSGEMHILGYYLDINNQQLLEALGSLQRYREERNPQMIEKLRELKIDITMEEVEAKAGGRVVGRPHFAAVLIEKGYVANPEEAFEKYLGTGKSAYVKKEKLTPAEGISLIRDAGGIPVLAHPKYIAAEQPMAFEDTLRKLQDTGLMGIEAYYSSHNSEETMLYAKMAQDLGLVVTGGTDFHGANKPEIEIGTGHGELRIPYRLLTELKKCR